MKLFPRFKIAAALSLAAAVCIPKLRAAEIPELILPAGAGVNIHFARGHEKDLDMIAAAGFKFVREDFFWESIEKTKGEYDWSAYDELVANLERRGIHPYFILDYSNPLYEQIVTAKNPISQKIDRSLASPQHPESIEAFARFAAAAAKHFRSSHIIWEIWNEPNISFWKPKPDAAQYTALALAAGRAVREADPQATIVAPACSGFGWDFLDSFLKSGALEFLDAVSVHPYRSPRQPPETAARDFSRLREIIDRYAPVDKKGKIPIISGEWGYSSNTRGVSQEKQAQFIVRQQLSNLLNGIPVSIWYDWKNDGPDPDENEHNFGTVTQDLEPKPAYTAFQTMAHELSGYGVSRRLETENTNDFVLVLTNAADETRLAAWTLADPHPVTLDLGAGSEKDLHLVKGDGQRAKVEFSRGQISVTVTGQPEYVEFGKGARLKN